MKYFVIFLTIISLTVSSSEGVIEEINFDELMVRSDLILVGNVTEIQPSFHAGGFELTRDQFFHDVKLSIEETIHGDLSTNEISFRIVKDRQLEGGGASISTSQDFEVGERVVVFLEKDSDGFWGGNYHVVGMSQGKYLLADGKAHGSYFDGITEDGLLSMIEENIKEERQRQEDCKPVTIDYQIKGGTLTSICKQSKWMVGLTAEIKAYSDGEVILDIPKSMVFSLDSKDCDTSNAFIVLLDGKEIPLTVTENGSSNLVKIPFTEGDHEIQVAGTSIIPSPAPAQYCGIVMGYDSLYLPPKFQIERGMEPEQVKCNEGLELIIRSNDRPACVKSETMPDLHKRGIGFLTRNYMPYSPYPDHN